MVHALQEIWRVLAPGGILIDMRPLADHWPVEVVSLRDVKRTGRVLDLPEQTKSDIDSNEAMQEAERQGWFVPERSELFQYVYSWDTPSEMEEFVNYDWQDFIELDDQTKRATRAAWAVADADARVRLRMNVWIAKWRKADWSRTLSLRAAVHEGGQSAPQMGDS